MGNLLDDLMWYYSSETLSLRYKKQQSCVLPMEAALHRLAFCVSPRSEAKGQLAERHWKFALRRRYFGAWITLITTKKENSENGTTIKTTITAVSAGEKTKASFDEIQNLISAMRMRSQEAAAALLSTRSLTSAALLELTDDASTPPPKTASGRPSTESPEEAEDCVLAVELHPPPCVAAADAHFQAISPLTERSTPLPPPALAAYEEQPDRGSAALSSAPWRSALGDRSNFAAPPSTKPRPPQLIPTNRRAPASTANSDVIGTASSFQNWEDLEGIQGQLSISRLHHRESLEEGPAHYLALPPHAPPLQYPERPRALTAYSGAIYNQAHPLFFQRQEHKYCEDKASYQSLSSRGMPMGMPPGAEATWSKYRNLYS